MKKWLFIIIVILLGLVIVEWQQIKYANQKWEQAEANVKSYDKLLSDAQNSCSAFELTIDQLNYFKDSVLVELNNTRKELGIKDKNLKALQSIVSGFRKTDTLIMVDTLFRDPSFALDTLFGDKWYSVRLGLEYPSMIAVEPYFKSEKHVIVSSKKETINPPHKFFLFRWFQRKHNVLNIDVIEKNPYIDEQTSRYIEIIK